MKTFTPGPWVSARSIYQSQARVVSKKGGMVADVFAYDPEQAHSNATLIASAPEMYDMLAEVATLLEMEDGFNYKDKSELASEIENLLRKARGE